MSQIDRRESVKHDAAKKTVAKWINESNHTWKVRRAPSNKKWRSQTLKEDISDTIIECRISSAYTDARLTTGQNGCADSFETRSTLDGTSNADQVLAVADIMVARNGKFDCIIEMCATKPIRDKKIRVIERRIITQPLFLIEVDPEWVLRQSAHVCPPELLARRIVLLEPDYITLPYTDDGINHSGMSHEAALKQEENEQAAYAAIFASGSGDPDCYQEYWTDGLYIFKGKDRRGMVAYSCSDGFDAPF